MSKDKTGRARIIARPEDETERAAIMEYDGGLTREQADRAARRDTLRIQKQQGDSMRVSAKPLRKTRERAADKHMGRRTKPRPR